jgi:undecaprenyl pyrophosphate phosphatase UppP
MIYKFHVFHVIWPFITVIYHYMLAKAYHKEERSLLVIFKVVVGLAFIAACIAGIKLKGVKYNEALTFTCVVLPVVGLIYTYLVFYMRSCSRRGIGDNRNEVNRELAEMDGGAIEAINAIQRRQMDR